MACRPGVTCCSRVGHGRRGKPAEGPGEPFDPPEVEWTRVSPRLASARRVVTCGPLLLVGAALGVLGVVVDEVWLWLRRQSFRSPWRAGPGW